MRTWSVLIFVNCTNLDVNWTALTAHWTELGPKPIGPPTIPNKKWLFSSPATWKHSLLQKLSSLWSHRRVGIYCLLTDISFFTSYYNFTGEIRKEPKRRLDNDRRASVPIPKSTWSLADSVPALVGSGPLMLLGEFYVCPSEIRPNFHLTMQNLGEFTGGWQKIS